MSGIVEQAHIHVLVALALEGPSDGEHSPGDGRFPLRWFEPTRHSNARVVSVEESRQSQHDLTPDELGAALLAENVRCSRDREGLRHDVPDPAYRYVDPGYRLTCVQALKALRLLVEWSCQHDGFEGSRAHLILFALQARVTEVLPGTASAPWEWSAQLIKAVADGARR